MACNLGNCLYQECPNMRKSKNHCGISHYVEYVVTRAKERMKIKEIRD